MTYLLNTHWSLVHLYLSGSILFCFVQLPSSVIW